jgi:hypothetical protein
MPPGPDRSATAEMNELSRELAGAFGEKRKAYREHAKFTAEQAVQRIAQDASEDIDRILNAPLDAVSWTDVEALAQKEGALLCSAGTRSRRRPATRSAPATVRPASSRMPEAPWIEHASR